MSLGAANLRTTKTLPLICLAEKNLEPTKSSPDGPRMEYLCIPTFALNTRDQCSYILYIYIHGAYGRDPETTKTNRSFQQACEKFHPGHAPV